MKFAAQHKFTPEQEAKIKEQYATGDYSQGDLARRYGCSQGTISRIVLAKPAMGPAALQARIAELEAALRDVLPYVDTCNSWHREAQAKGYAALKGGKKE